MVVAAPGLVLDEDRLAPALAGLLADRARDDVGLPAGRERHDEANRLGGELLRLDAAAEHERGERRNNDALHDRLRDAA